ncbi:hypothetical protein PVAP13_8KG133702 [Panicum virgatum]|uniref:Uncharacterized protein n=1 Tax=Panicum virgatum TaxID=38727 RepID=A0A8T0PKH9_PANVG|nr:hypothetical protein PVAP13_8KG133702 [Panicum virgatum]
MNVHIHPINPTNSRQLLRPPPCQHGSGGRPPGPTPSAPGWHTAALTAGTRGHPSLSSSETEPLSPPSSEPSPLPHGSDGERTSQAMTMAITSHGRASGWHATPTGGVARAPREGTTAEARRGLEGLRCASSARPR